MRQFIDNEVEAAWQRDKITPAPPADDATFLRRATLDLVGTVPTYAEVTAFLADTGSDKRATLLARLMADPRFAPLSP